MAWALVDHASAGASGGGGSCTTPTGHNSTGANFMVVSVAAFSADPLAANLADNKGNTGNFVALTPRGTGSRTRLFYCQNPTVGANHQVTFDQAGTAPEINVAWFSGGDISSVFEAETGSGTLTPGSLTPAQNNELVITSVAGAGGVANCPGFAVTDAVAFSSGNSMQGGLAYLIQTTAAAANPTWSDGAATAMACFKVGADTTPPNLSSPTGTATGASTASGGATTDEGNGTMYGVITTSPTAPTATQVIAGQDATGAAAVATASLAVSSTGAKSMSFTGLAANTSYYCHTAQQDAVGNKSSVVSSAQFTTNTAYGCLVCLGDSFTANIGVTAGQRYPDWLQAALGPTGSQNWAVRNAGVGGQTISACQGRISTDVDPYLRGSNFNVVILYAGINDMSPDSGGSSDGATAYAALRACCAALRADSHVGKVIIWTMPPGGNSTYQTRRNAFNALIRAETSPLWDAVIDGAFDQTFGSDAATGDSTYYLGDGHPNATLTSLYGRIAAAAVNRIVYPVAGAGGGGLKLVGFGGGMRA